jgi:hypothetical protein
MKTASSNESRQAAGASFSLQGCSSGGVISFGLYRLSKDGAMGGSMMKTRKVCLLVVHGIGEQNPLETLDAFTRSLVHALYSISKQKVEMKHIRGRVAGQVDDYIRLSYSLGAPIELDLHEYYWASNMQRLISLGETIEWLIKTAKGAETFYDENEELALKYEGYQKGRRWYLKHLGDALQYIYRLRSLTKFLPRAADPLLRLVLGQYAQKFVDYLGDIAIYTSSDVKSKFYEIRQAVLDGMIRKLSALIENEYDKVIIIGHSLGSLLAYDALNQINLEMNVNEQFAAHSKKQFELITLGSPLDKAAFFFREHLNKDDYVKQLVINNVNGFRQKFVENPEGEEYTVSSNVKDYLAHLLWVNYWHPDDPISGNLDYYEGVANVRLNDDISMEDKPFFFISRLLWKIKLYVKAHNHYWVNERIFRETIERTLEMDISRKKLQDVLARKEPEISKLLNEYQDRTRRNPNQEPAVH